MVTPIATPKVLCRVVNCPVCVRLGAHSVPIAIRWSGKSMLHTIIALVKSWPLIGPTKDAPTPRSTLFSLLALERLPIVGGVPCIGGCLVGRKKGHMNCFVSFEPPFFAGFPVIRGEIRGFCETVFFFFLLGLILCGVLPFYPFFPSPAEQPPPTCTVGPLSDPSNTHDACNASKKAILKQKK